MIKDILGGGILDISPDSKKGNCSCGCGCGKGSASYSDGLDAGIRDTTSDGCEG